jgi:hypothetical protein
MKTAFTILVLTCFAALTGYCGQKHPAELCGRWKSDIADTGYWIIDRYPSGAFAGKEFVNRNLNLPWQIEYFWGTWQISDNKYFFTVHGTTSSSESAKTSINEMLTRRIKSKSPSPFRYDVSDGERIETSLNDQTPFSRLQLAVPSPDEVSNPPKSWHDTTKKPGVPDWVLASTGIPKRPSGGQVIPKK